MRRIVFYSWQSDLPNTTNRGFIQTALEQAAAAIAADDTVAVEPVVDRDTQNAPGSPDIASTIFAKIAAADMFVADVSIVTRAGNTRCTPNPNVLVELGYALNAMGPERIILVFNRSFGRVEELPFDLRTRRILVYEMAEDATARAPDRKKLERQLEEALRATLVVTREATDAVLPVPVLHAIENVAPNRRIILRRTLDEWFSSILGLEPRKHRDGGTADELIAALGKTQEVVAQFSKVAETIAVMDDVESAIDLYGWFGKLFERYTAPDTYSGTYSEADFDYFRFIGNEMFVTFVAYQIREQRWETLAHLLDEPIPMYIRNRGQGSVDWEYASQHLPLLIEEGSKRQRTSLHADLLNERHAQSGGLAAILPMQDFADADFFLFLLGRTLKDETGFDRHYWRAWSSLYLRHTPRFIQNAQRIQVAERIARTMKLENAAAFKKFVRDRGPELLKLFGNAIWRDYPIRSEDIDKIATR